MVHPDRHEKKPPGRHAELPRAGGTAGSTTGTLGVREFPCSRVTLTRSFRTADTPWGPVRIKHAEGFGVVREKAEYEDLKAIAEKEKLTLTEVRKALKDPPA